MESAMSELVLQLDRVATDDEVTSDLAPPSTPEKVFKYSEHIHKDRHIFLGQAYLSMINMVDYDRGDVYGFNFNPVRLPSLSKVSLSLDVFHTPPQRRFNENINTYVDTRKRIRMVQYVDDFDRYSMRTSPLPYVDRSSVLGSGLLKTSPIRRPDSSAENSQQLPPLKRTHGGLEQTSFPFKLHKEGTFNFASAMPTRFAIKPISIWRQKTDTFLYGRKLNLQRRANIPSQ